MDGHRIKDAVIYIKADPETARGDKGQLKAKENLIAIDKTRANQLKASPVWAKQVHHRQAARIHVDVCF